MSHHQHAGVQYTSGKGLRSPLRMATEAGCPARMVHPSQPCVPTHSLHCSEDISCTIFPATASCSQGFPRHCQRFIQQEDAYALQFICMNDDTSHLGWVKGTNSGQLYCTHAHIAHWVMMEETDHIWVLPEESDSHQNKMFGHQCSAAWKHFCSVWRVVIFLLVLSKAFSTHPLVKLSEISFMCSSPRIMQQAMNRGLLPVWWQSPR